MNKKELESYFKSDKTDWYTLDEEKNKIWDVNRVSEFWERIRMYKIKKEDFDFSFYIFPDFEFERETKYLRDNSSNEGKESNQHQKIKKEFDFFTKIRYSEKGFSKKVSFFSSIFLGNASFYKYYFKGKVDFSQAEFYGYIGFDECTFFDDVSFNNIITNHRFTLFNSSFKKKLNFCHAELDEFTFFYNTKFDSTNFFGSNFKEETYFSDSLFKKEATFMDCIFEKDLRLNNIVFEYQTNFSNFTVFGEASFHNVLFGNNVDYNYIKIDGRLKIQSSYFFRDCYFNYSKINKLEFIDLNVKKEEENLFLEIPYKEVYYESSLWKELNNISKSPRLIFDNISFNSDTIFTRVILNNIELFNCDVADIKFSRCDWNIDKKRLLLRKEELDYRDSEAHYRQLKKNFDSEKNWELSGYSYVSEMEMRKKRLWKEKKYADWFIYKFYDFFGGYTQNYLRPFLSLLVLIVLSSVIYYFIDYNLLKAIQRGLKGSIPYLQIDIEKPFYGYWLIWKNIQLVLSGTFIAFFILALRKRFKQ